MNVKDTNWLDLVGREILKRGTLYPDNEIVVPGLTDTNWLTILRDDILARQTLHPHGGNVGQITSTNFLVKLREDMQKDHDANNGHGEYEEEWPLIPNPITATNTWMMGDRGRTSDDKKWVSLINHNVWQPSEYPQGWREVV